MRALIDSVSIIAVRGAVFEGVPFEQAPVLVAGADGKVFEAARFSGAEVDGVEFTSEELSACIAGGDATLLDVPVPLRPGAVAWLSGTPAYSDTLTQRLRSSGQWVHHIRHDRGATLLVCRPASDDVRRGLYMEQQSATEWAIRRYRSDGIVSDATLAWLLADPVSPKDVALLIRAYEICGEAERGLAIAAMEYNSHEANFRREVAEELARMPFNRLRAAQLHSLLSQQRCFEAAAA